MRPQTEPLRGILITEDHKPTADLLRMLLTAAFPGYPISTAASGEEALVLCRTVPPKVVIMDVSLPGMNGIEATRRIKAAMPAVKVVVHSSNDAAVYAEACVGAGACAYVPKSKPAAELIPVIAQLLSAGATPVSGK
jgi:DNA-binding NarL/FixJ family response regulator